MLDHVKLLTDLLDDVHLVGTHRGTLLVTLTVAGLAVTLVHDW